MPEPDRFRFSDAPDMAIPLHLVDKDNLSAFLAQQEASVRAWVDAMEFKATAGQALVVPGPDGKPVMALAGYGTPAERSRRRFILAAAAQKLPAGRYHLASDLPEPALSAECLGWLLSAYRFGRYHDSGKPAPRLVAPQGVDAHRIELIARAEALTRDLINTPASDMGPDELEAAARNLAASESATVEVTAGQSLADGNFPLIHAVGRASDRTPRLIDLRWGSGGPALTLVGKGVCFDTGGLNLKPGASMKLMKKDMGGAAAVLGLAQMIMGLNLPLRLRVLIPAVENAVSGSAYRPGDILTSRKGLTVEINNTDAEGRLVLADALSLAAEEDPALIVSMATLTGAARVAVGPDLAPFYASDDEDARTVEAAASRAADPVWRMPFHDPYDKDLEPGVADLDNAPSGGFAGSIMAALFLRRFAGEARYLHFDIYGWQPVAAPARPKGGVGQGTRALLDALPRLLGL